MSNNVAATLVRVVPAALIAVFGTGDLKAQKNPPPFTAQQCDQIRNNILGIFRRYDGKLSTQLVTDIKQFSRKDCDRSVKLRIMVGTSDKEAVAELRILIAARELK